jgi:hypothetical protein
MHTDMRSFQSRLDRVEQGQSKDNNEGRSWHGIGAKTWRAQAEA